MSDLENDDIVRKALSAGLPSYIMQEEFNRYTGFWWCPVLDQYDPNYTYILYEQTDESEVKKIQITSHEGFTEEHRFPKPGEVNAKAILKLIKIGTNYKIRNEIFDLKFDLHEYFPWYEYLVRAGWTPDGKK